MSVVRELKPNKPARAKILQMPDGTPAQSPLQARQTWQQFFSDKLCGFVCSAQKLLDDSIVTQDELFKSLSHADVHIDDIMSPTDLMRLLQVAPAGRGHGEDALPAKFYKLCARLMAHIIHPLMLKAICRVQEPLAWKGGMLGELFKGSGDQQICNNSRGILVSDHVGKRLHSWYRGRLLPTFRSMHASHSTVESSTKARACAPTSSEPFGAIVKLPDCAVEPSSWTSSEPLTRSCGNWSSEELSMTK